MSILVRVKNGASGDKRLILSYQFFPYVLSTSRSIRKTLKNLKQEFRKFFTSGRIIIFMIKIQNRV